MTISTIASSQVNLGNGVTNTFTYDFVCDSAADLEVIYTDTAGTQTNVPAAQYTLFRNPPATGSLHSVGGQVTYPTAGSPIANGTSLTISRIVPLTQTTSISNQGDFYPTVVEDALDELCLQIQQVSARTGQLRGVWVAGTTYNYADVVQDGINGGDTGNLYFCSIANISSVWATDLAAGDWSLALDAQSIVRVTSVSVTTANGFAGTVTDPTTTPAITLETTVTGLLKGNGTGVSAAATTGTGSVVQATSPTLVTPILGQASATDISVGDGSFSTTTTGAIALSSGTPILYYYNTGQTTDQKLWETRVLNNTFVLRTRTDVNGAGNTALTITRSGTGITGWNLSMDTAGLYTYGTGIISGTAFHNNSAAQGGAAQQDIRSGTYTPTLTNTTNVAASTPHVTQWMRVGNVVTVAGNVTITATASATNTILGMSLPVASNITGDENLGGCAQNTTAGDQPSVSISGGASTDTALFQFTPNTTSARTYSFTFTYLVQ